MLKRLSFPGIILGILVLAAILGPVVAPFGVNEQDPSAIRQPPSADHWFGTDQLGRDVFSRVLLGAREVIVFAGLGTLAAAAAGGLLGLLSGYIGGLFDELLMRIFDALLSIPVVLFALLMLAFFNDATHAGKMEDFSTPTAGLDLSALRVMFVLAIAYTPIITRVVRSVVLPLKEKAFVQAARTQGASTFQILFQEILPFVYPVLFVETAIRFSYAIFLVASLGFLGVGIQPPSPNWGLMVSEARQHAASIPWALYFPAGAIALLVISVNLAVDRLRKQAQSPGNRATP